MDDTARPGGAGRPFEGTPTRELLQRLVRDSKELVQAEVALAKSELKTDVRRELHLVEGLSVAALCGLLTLNLLLLSIVFALANVIPGWASALIVAAAVLTVGTAAGFIGWRTRAKEPLRRTQTTLKEDVQWAKQRVSRTRSPSSSSIASRRYAGS